MCTFDLCVPSVALQTSQVLVATTCRNLTVVDALVYDFLLPGKLNILHKTKESVEMNVWKVFTFKIFFAFSCQKWTGYDWHRLKVCKDWGTYMHLLFKPNVHKVHISRTCTMQYVFIMYYYNVLDVHWVSVTQSCICYDAIWVLMYHGTFSTFF